MPDREDDEDTDRRPSAAELRHHRRTVPRGIPALADSDPEPDWEWPPEPDRRDAETLRRAGRDPSIPVHPAEVSAIVRRLRDEFAKMLNPADLDRLREVVEGRGGLAQQVATHAEVIGPMRSTASWALRGVVAAVIVVGGFLYKRGADEQRITDEIAAVRRENERLANEITLLRNQFVKDKP